MLAFLPQVCYNLLSFILTKRERADALLNADKQGPDLTPQRRLPPQMRRAASSPAVIPSPTTAERRGEPLPGLPVTAQREALSFGRRNSGGTVERFPASIDRRFIPCIFSAG